MLEKLALPTVKEELPRLHASHAQMLPEEAETEYLKVSTLEMHLLLLLIWRYLYCCTSCKEYGLDIDLTWLDVHQHKYLQFKM